MSKKREKKSAALTAEIDALREQIAALRAEASLRNVGQPSTAASPAEIPEPATAGCTAPPVFQHIPVYELKESRLSGLQLPAYSSGQSVFSGLAERSRLQWINGNWESLARLEACEIEHHPDRAVLALLASTALCRLGNLAAARNLLGLALKWGCERETASRLVWASLHRNLAVVHALSRRPEQARQHLQLASIVTGESALPLQETAPATPCLPGLDMLPVKSRFSLATVSKRSAVIMVAGMRHSGSTALFNILRLGLSKAGHQFVSCYSEHENCASKVRQSESMGLIKTHEFRDDLLVMADFVFTSRRDLRDTVASAARRDFPLYRQLKSPVEYAKYNRALYEMWAPQSDFEFVYEKFQAEPVSVTGDVLEASGLDRSMAAEIYREVLELPTDDYQTTLLSPTHITDPTHRLTYRDTLAPADIMAMQAHHHDWLQRHGYAIANELPSNP